jgi:hypothetical protein
LILISLLICLRSRFKTRHHLVSRRQTSDRKLPANAPDLCRAFIQECHEIIDTHKIKPKNIINMDQIPRYYETEPKSTICSRGSRQVLLAKGGTSHRRFTLGLSITAQGKHLDPHVLISGRTTRPDAPHGVHLDVNPTGIFNLKNICFLAFLQIFKSI